MICSNRMCRVNVGKTTERDRVPGTNRYERFCIICGTKTIKYYRKSRYSNRYTTLPSE